MRKILLYTILIGSALMLNSCLVATYIAIKKMHYAPRKLSEPKTIFIPRPNDVTFDFRAEGVNPYTGIFPLDEYKKAYFDQLRTELQYSGFEITSDNPDYILNITKVFIRESSKAEIIYDEYSDEDGVTFYINQIEMLSYGTVEDMCCFKEHPWKAFISKQEHLDKDEHYTKDSYGNEVLSYRSYSEKYLPENIGLIMDRQLGMRSVSRITKTVKNIQRDKKEAEFCCN